jgi:hypothetical protein
MLRMCFSALGDDSALRARGKTFRAKKISPVIDGNLLSIQGLRKIVTGNNRRLFSAMCRLFDRKRARTHERPRASRATDAPRVSRNVATPPRPTFTCKLHARKHATWRRKHACTIARNVGSTRFLERTAKLFREFPANVFAGQKVRKDNDFFGLFLNQAASKICP